MQRPAEANPAIACIAASRNLLSLANSCNLTERTRSYIDIKTPILNPGITSARNQTFHMTQDFVPDALLSA
jgi:hypothetical protein